MNIRTFFGILFPKLPYADAVSPPETLPVPARATLLWPGNAGLNPGLGTGDHIKTGQNLAKTGSAPLVSTVTGRIEEVSGFKGPDGQDYAAVSVLVDPKETSETSLQPLENFDEVDPSVLRAAINDAGFTGLSAISPDPSHWPPVKVLVISAFDQDPLSIANQQAFRDHLHQVGTGIHLLARATEASRTVLAVPKNLAEMAADISLNGAAIAVLPPVYPNGLPEILAKKCGAGFLMKGSEVGVTGNTLVVSVETAVAMATSLQTGRPLLEKTVTFSAGRGGPLKNLRVRIGTPIAHILKHQGVTLGSKGKLILNGMMRGYACFSDEQPITATTESVHVQTPSEVFSFQNTACINCGKCAAICPVDLEAGLLGRLSEYGIFEKCKRLGAENCIECGLCAYICPGHRPLVQLISHAKQRIHPPAVQHISLEEGLVCDKCGPACVTIGLFESESKREEDGREE